MATVPRRPLRIGIFGEFGTGNLGNDASLLAAIDALRTHAADVEVLCISSAPTEVTRRYGLRAVSVRAEPSKRRAARLGYVTRVVRRLSDVVRMYRIARGLDAVVVPGMGVLEAGSSRPGAFPSTLLTVCVAARAAGARFALVSVGADRTHRRSTRWLLRLTLRLATYRSFRDVHSRRYASELSQRSAADPIYPDIVLGRGQPCVAGRPREGEKVVGVGVISYRGAFYDDEPTARDLAAARYTDQITEFVAWLLDQSFTVKLLVGDEKDYEVAELICGRLSSHQKASRLEIAQSESFDDLLTHISQADFVVASRYHNLVAALLLARPLLSVDYKRKNHELMSMVGCQHLSQELTALDLDLLRAQFLDLVRSGEEISSLIATKRRLFCEQIAEQWSIVHASLSSPKV